MVGWAIAFTVRPLQRCRTGSARRKIVVPHAVVHHPGSPHLRRPVFTSTATRLYGKERAARPVAAVIIAGRHFDGPVHETELRVGAHLRPDAGIAVVLRGVPEPRVVTELAAPGNRGKIQPFARADVVAAHLAARCRRPAMRPGAMGHDNEITSPTTRGVAFRPSSAVFQIDLLVVLELQIDRAVHAERRNGTPVLASSASIRYPDVT